MKRRNFLGLSSAALGLASFGGMSVFAQGADGERQYLELQKFTFEKEEQKQAFHAYMKEAAIPALNRLGIKPVGVLTPDPANPPKDPAYLNNIFVILPHPNADSALTLNRKLLADAGFTGKSDAYISAIKAEAQYKELESWLMLAFKGMPKIERPSTVPDRVFQLRIYESPSLKTGQKKIEMFNDAGEIKIFREVGLNPVFFGEVLFGAKLPNLTYMLSFDNTDAMKAAWKKFGGHPEWQRLKGMQEYADNRILRNIINLVLKPTEYSQL
ncbi:MAG: NIPSNAP family protein [Verrucomicrobiota bacterium]